MLSWKLPPKAKIYEALSAIVDGRVLIVKPGEAQVTSSSGAKAYTVEWNEDVQQITSNDNASYWQGYAGYPIVAVLLTVGKLDYSKEIAKELAGIPWKAVNQKHRNNYEKAIEEVMSSIRAKGGSPESIREEVDRIMAQLKTLRLERLHRGKKPPVG